MIEIVPNEPQFYEFIRVLRNDQRVNQGFIEKTPVSRREQDAYMAKHADEYILAVIDGAPAGYAGSVDGDIRVCTHPDFQGRGVGRALVEAIHERFPASTARVMVGNEASLRLFEACGFVPTFVLFDPPVGDS